MKGVGVVGVVGHEELTRKDVEGLTFERDEVFEGAKVFFGKKMQKRDQTSWFTGSRRTFAFDPPLFSSSPHGKGVASD